MTKLGLDGPERRIVVEPSKPVTVPKQVPIRYAPSEPEKVPVKV